LPHLLDMVEFGLAGAKFPFDIASVTDNELRQFGSLYVSRLRAHAPQAERVVDKQLLNFRLAGLIHLILPNAHIIHVRRDPMDTCFSCFTKVFPFGLEFAFDLGELGRYYRSYDRLMKHWAGVFPEGAMLEVNYEDLVTEFEMQARRIVAYCGLDWDDRCLSFHRTERPIRTASAVQVRQPLYRSAVGRSAPYAAWLGPLRDAMQSSRSR
jgi:Sulfotransferase family